MINDLILLITLGISPDRAHLIEQDSPKSSNVYALRAIGIECRLGIRPDLAKYLPVAVNFQI
jgi:hypothetical protein